MRDALRCGRELITDIDFTRAVAPWFIEFLVVGRRVHFCVTPFGGNGRAGCVCNVWSVTLAAARFFVTEVNLAASRYRHGLKEDYLFRYSVTE